MAFYNTPQLCDSLSPIHRQVPSMRLPSFGDFLTTTVNDSHAHWRDYQRPWSSSGCHQSNGPPLNEIASNTSGTSGTTSGGIVEYGSRALQASTTRTSLSEPLHSSGPVDETARGPNLAFATALKEPSQPHGTRVSKSRRPRKDRNQPINPHFTRDGNPRKRLARACDRCRSQKIRCRLENQICLQCSRLGMKCSFVFGGSKRQRTGYERSRSATDDATKDTGMSSPDLREVAAPATCMSIKNMLLPTEEQQDFFKERQSTHDDTREHNHQAYVLSSPSAKLSLYRDVRSVSDNTSADIGPAMIDMETILYYTALFFEHCNTNYFCLLSKHTFIAWLKQQRNKVTTENMVVYAVVAAGALYVGNKSGSELCFQALRIAEDALAITHDRFTIEAIHTNLILSTVYSNWGDLNRAWEHNSAALQTAYGMKLNYEAHSSDSQQYPGYTTYDQRAECQRRTFWLAHARLGLLSSFRNDSNLLSPFRGTTQLPGNDSDHGNSSVDELGSDQTRYASTSLTTLFIKASSLLQQAVSWIQSSRGLRENEYRRQLSETIISVERSLKLLQEYMVSPDGYIQNEPEIQIQLIDHSVHILLYRHVRHDFLDTGEVGHHIRRAQNHASELLQSLSLWNANGGNGRCLDPLIASSILLAFDTITAMGSVSKLLTSFTKGRGEDLLSTMTTAITVLSELTDISQLTREQLHKAEPRLAALLTYKDAAIRSVGEMWQFQEPLHDMFGPEMDVMYGSSTEKMLSALGLDTCGAPLILDTV